MDEGPATESYLISLTGSAGPPPEIDGPGNWHTESSHTFSRLNSPLEIPLSDKSSSATDDDLDDEPLGLAQEPSSAGPFQPSSNSFHKHITADSAKTTRSRLAGSPEQRRQRARVNVRSGARDSDKWSEEQSTLRIRLGRFSESSVHTHEWYTRVVIHARGRGKTVEMCRREYRFSVCVCACVCVFVLVCVIFHGGNLSLQRRRRPRN